MVALVFTGHRQVDSAHTTLIRNKIINYPNLEMLFVGGAMGGDTLAMLAGSSIGVPITVVVPAILHNQPASFVEAYNSLLIAPTLVEMGLEYNAVSLKARNRKMVDLAIEQYPDNVEMLAYWSGKFRSGTYSAMCYAKSVGVPVRYLKL